MGGKCVCVRHHYGTAFIFKVKVFYPARKELCTPRIPQFYEEITAWFSVSIKQPTMFFSFSLKHILECCTQALTLNKGLSILVPLACAKLRIRGLRVLPHGAGHFVCCVHTVGQTDKHWRALPAFSLCRETSSSIGILVYAFNSTPNLTDSSPCPTAVITCALGCLRMRLSLVDWLFPYCDNHTHRERLGVGGREGGRERRKEARREQNNLRNEVNHWLEDVFL